MKDVIFHLADQHMEVGFRAFFRRDDWHYALGCGNFQIDPEEGSTDIYRVSGHTDGGIWKHAHANLAPFRKQYKRAVIVLDADFEPHPGAQTLQKDISDGMIESGWEADRFCVVVIQPELEAWLWAPNVNVAKAFGHPNFEDLQAALSGEGLWSAGSTKPHDLKRARDRATKLGGKKTGGPIFKGVFGGISRRACDLCEEPGFIAMRSALKTWFPVEGALE